MSAGGETHGAHTAWIDSVRRRAVADQAHCALGVGQRDVRARCPAFVRKSVEQDKGRDTPSGEPARHLIAFLVDDNPAVAAAGRDQDSRSVRSPWPEHRHAGFRDAAHEAIAVARIGAAFGNRFHRWSGRPARRAARPKINRLERIGQRTPQCLRHRRSTRLGTRARGQAGQRKRAQKRGASVYNHAGARPDDVRT